MAVYDRLRRHWEATKNTRLNIRVYLSHCLTLLMPDRTPRFSSYYGEMAPGDLNRWSDQAIENFIEEARIQQSMQFSMLTSAHTRTRFAFGTGIAAFIIALRAYERTNSLADVLWWIAAAIFFLGLWGSAANLATKDIVALNDILVLSNKSHPPSRRTLARAYLAKVPRVSDVVATRMHIYRSSLRLMIGSGSFLLFIWLWC